MPKNKPHIHYHSDCDFFAGCENMVANFLNSDELYEEFTVSFSYRKSSRYEEGLKSRVKETAPREFYKIFSGNILIDSCVNRSKFIRSACRIFNYILLIRVWVFCWNTIVFYKEWRKKEIDILHINNGGYPAAISCLSASVAGKLLNIKTVLMVVNNLAPPSRFYRWQDIVINFLVKRSVTTFITGSINTKNFLQQLLKLESHRFKTLYNGISIRPITETREQTRARLGVKNKLVFGVVALLEKRKGHHILIESVSLLTKSLSTEIVPIFLLEGDGTEKENLMKLVEKYDLNSTVQFIGNEKNIFNFIQSLDVLLLPSISNEDFPNVILEGMSLGKPVIASRIAGTIEQVIDGITGFLVQPANPVELAEKIKKIIEEESLIESMGSAGKNRFQNEFTSKVAIRRYIDLYKAHLNGVKYD